MAARLLNKAGWIAAGVLALLLIAALAGVVLGGPLDPPSSPGPTGKTLHEVEPRTVINSIPYTITQPGSYYLASTQYCSCPTSDGIHIDADDVTLDLNGFGVVAAAGANGVMVVGIHSDITVRNGTIAGWSGTALDMRGALWGTVSGVRAWGNVGAGIWVNSNSTISDCVAYANSQEGIRVEGADSLIRNCNVIGNGASGILLAAGGWNNRVTGNHLAQNHAGITVASTNNVIEDNTAVSSATYGIQVTAANNQIYRNAARNSTTANYSIAAGNDAGPTGAAGTATSPWANIDN